MTSDVTWPGFRIAGIRLDALLADEVAAQVASFGRLRDGRTRTVCFVNAYSIVSARDDAAFSRAIDDADLSVIDGVPVAWVGRWLSGARCERLSGPDLMHLLLSGTSYADLRHFVYGGDEETLSRLEFRYSRGGTQNPRRIVGTWSPPFRDLTETEERTLLARLDSLQPDILWVCLGTGRQEKWMAAMKDRLRVPVLAGVGAAVDFLSGNKSRAPRWMQNLGLEWLFRLATEPRRLWRRYILGNISFIMLVVAEVFRKGRPTRGERE